MNDVLDRLERVVLRLEAIESRLPTASHEPPAQINKQAPSSDQFVQDYENIVATLLPNVQTAVSKLDSDVLQNACELFVGVFQSELPIIKLMARCKAPPTAKDLQAILTPVAEKMTGIGRAAIPARNAATWTSHLKLLEEASGAGAWVAYSGPSSGLRPPPEHVKDARNAADFYAIRILKEWRTSPQGETHVEFVNSVKTLLQSLEEYCARWHKASPSWNPHGVPFDPSSPAPTPQPQPQQQHSSPVKPLDRRGHLECEQNRRWVIEYFKNEDIVIEADKTAHHQSIYIFDCQGCRIQIMGKVNAITVDSCADTALLFQAVVSCCEVINCTKAGVEAKLSVPTLNVDKTDGCQIYLPEAAVATTQITTSKSSGVNIVALEDNKEYPIPEQFMSTIVSGRLVTTPVVHSAG